VAADFDIYTVNFWRTRAHRPQGARPRAPRCMMFHVSTSNIIETLLLRNLREVFGEGDPERRRIAIEELYTQDCVVNLPVDQYHGHEALDRICSELRASHPRYVYTPHSAPLAVQNGGRVDWGSGPAGEPPRYTGIDVIITRDEKISALYVFLNSPPI
jgi:SnoaL-like domain